jgi:Asp-tRNA(Asn)/Glu-tRNA(Gln) amidotransferase A subunit family amidase
MNIDEQLCWRPADEIADGVRRGAFSAREVTDAFLDRVEQLEPKLHAFITVAADHARAQASAIDALPAAKRDALLLGVPFGTKDNVFTAGVRTTMGSRLFENHTPSTDALMIERLSAAGAVLLGKTNLPEFSMWGRSGNLVTPECRNPWDPRRTCGGSSGGSGAAVAAGMTPIAIGTDDGGSIRLPAALNGVFGLYPSPNQVPLEGCVIGGFVSAAGPLTRHVRDAALVLDAVKPGQDLAGSIDLGVSGLRMVWVAEHEDTAFNDPRVVEAARTAAFALEQAGARVEDPEFVLVETQGAAPLSPFPEQPSYGGVRPFELPETKKITAEPGWEKLLAPNARQSGIVGNELVEITEEMARRRRRVVDQIRGLHETYDVILTPTIDQVAPLIPGDWSYPYAPPGSPAMEAIRQYVKYTHRVNLAGCVAASVPCGFVDGMPAGLQVIGRPGAELTVLRVARALEQITPWADKRPPTA